MSDNDLIRKSDALAAVMPDGFCHGQPTTMGASRAAITAIPAVTAPDALHRSFPEAGDGRPLPPMGDELMTAGLSAEDARFVAVQLAQNGWALTPTAVDASQPADPAAYNRGYEDCLYQRGDAPDYSLAPHLQRIVEGAKTAPQWDTESDRMAATDPTEYERKVAQMKEDFPNGI